MALRESVTAQEYDQALRDSVNAYYEHAMNDPSMSQEEAISSTSQMAEQYLAATEEFQANLESLSNETGNEQGAEVGGIEGTDAGGMDGGDDGGIDSDDGGIE